MSKIPKIIHQIWIGSKPAPMKLMNTWRELNPDFEYIFWNEKEFEKRGIVFEAQNKINSMEEMCGKADIIRWQLLWMFGGVYIDADSICIEPIDDFIMNYEAFAGYENEKVRQGLVANGTMGFPPNHSLCRDATNWILNNPVSFKETKQRAWQNTGPCLLTGLLQTNKYPNFKVFPSHYFIPFHYSGVKYEGHDKIYAYQEWGSTKQNYDTMNNIELPNELNEPSLWVSLLICSYNTKHKYITDCLNSIKEQTGHFGMEIVWVNDGSNLLATTLLEKTLDMFQKTTRFCKIVYHKNDKNYGVSKSLHDGLLLCSNEIVFRMDSDDIMLPHRISKQLHFFNTNPGSILCGADICLFNDNAKIDINRRTNHPQELTWEQYKQSPKKWFMNHPTLCFKKSAILSIGNYNKENKHFEDLELELNVLQRFGVLYNIPEVLLLYRLHENQVTNNNRSSEIQNKIQYFIDTKIK